MLHTDNKLPEREIKKTVLFIAASKAIKYLGIKLTMEVKDPNNDNYKTLMKETEKTQINEKIFYAHSLEDLILLKCPFYPEQSTM